MQQARHVDLPTGDEQKIDDDNTAPPAPPPDDVDPAPAPTNVQRPRRRIRVRRVRIPANTPHPARNARPQRIINEPARIQPQSLDYYWTPTTSRRRMLEG